jgi:hypothetical protein
VAVRLLPDCVRVPGPPNDCPWTDRLFAHSRSLPPLQKQGAKSSKAKVVQFEPAYARVPGSSQNVRLVTRGSRTHTHTHTHTRAYAHAHIFRDFIRPAPPPPPLTHTHPPAPACLNVRFAYTARARLRGCVSRLVRALWAALCACVQTPSRLPSLGTGSPSPTFKKSVSASGSVKAGAGAPLGSPKLPKV